MLGKGVRCSLSLNLSLQQARRGVWRDRSVLRQPRAFSRGILTRRKRTRPRLLCLEGRRPSIRLEDLSGTVAL